MNRRTMFPGMALLASLLLAQAASAATAYYVQATDVYARSAPQSYAMGRLYRDERMDIQYIDSNGWAYGYAYGQVQRCVWAQYSVTQNGATTLRFWTHGTGVADRCRNTDRYLYESEFSNGEIWGRGATDGDFYRLPRPTHMWDNWNWGGRWGRGTYRGVSPQGSLWRIRYTTNDGGGVMARPCTESASGVSCASDWYFIQRSSVDTLQCGSLGSGQNLFRGGTVNSCDGRFSLTLQPDQNLVLYQSGVGALWALNTAGSGANQLAMQGDGNLVLYTGSYGVVWATNTNGHTGAFLGIQSDGNVVLYNTAWAVLWQTGTCCR